MSTPSLPPARPLSRRAFLAVAAGGAVALTFPACRSGSGGVSASSTTSALGPPAGRPSASDVGATAAGGPASGRSLVILELDGGNDGLSAVVPADGRYRDARPTLAIPEGDVVALGGTTEVGLHPALDPLASLWDGGRMAILRGVGFPEPNRSHFVSLDRWWRADRGGSAPGWLAGWIDSLPDAASPLAATSLGGGSPLLTGAGRLPTTVIDPAAFSFTSTEMADGMSALATPSPGGSEDPLVAGARSAMARATTAVEDFAARRTAAESDDLDPASPFTEGLSLAAELVAAASGPTVVVVAASGFDTHAGQTASHQRLYADLAAGIIGFFARADAGGFAERSLVVTTSEFGRRVAENGSGGTDHGAANVSLAFGPNVVGGVHGETDLGDLLDGDVRPTVDPRSLYTGCLDWLGADVDIALWRRYDDVTFVRT